ncbi:transmembrane O-mannosyltransferase targeting cadherins 2 [Brevipalpus obovatus]|uniref:transmembrane O-mannosyltransferase targeting cadherins 2 n=1 Tax=Brevipalpus obovatus TaxID=246614 RepID=UPI003D9E695F
MRNRVNTSGSRNLNTCSDNSSVQSFPYLFAKFFNEDHVNNHDDCTKDVSYCHMNGNNNSNGGSRNDRYSSKSFISDGSTTSSSSSCSSSELTPIKGCNKSASRYLESQNQQVKRIKYYTDFMSQFSSIQLYFIITLVSIGLYFNTLDANFAYDDSRAIESNQDLRPNTPWTKIFTNDFWGTPLSHSGSHKSYRPLCTLSFRLNYMLHQLRPWGYHMVNVALNSLVTLLFTHISLIIFNYHLGYSLTAGLLFAVHPIHTEAVAGIVGRADVGAALFYLLALKCYIIQCNTCSQHHQPCSSPSSSSSQTDSNSNNNHHHSHLFAHFTIMFTTLSMLTKEYGITVIAVCAVYDLAIQYQFSHLTKNELIQILKQKKYSCLRKRLFYLGFSAIFLLIGRLYVMGLKVPGFSSADNPAANCDKLWTRVLTFLYLPAFNFILLIYPQWLSFDWSMESIPLVESTMDPRNLLTIIFYSMLCILLRIVYSNQCHNLNTSHLSSHNGKISPVKHPSENSNSNNNNYTHNGNNNNYHHSNGTSKSSLTPHLTSSMSQIKGTTNGHTEATFSFRMIASNKSRQHSLLDYINQSTKPFWSCLYSAHIDHCPPSSPVDNRQIYTQISDYFPIINHNNNNNNNNNNIHTSSHNGNHVNDTNSITNIKFTNERNSNDNCNHRYQYNQDYVCEKKREDDGFFTTVWGKFFNPSEKIRDKNYSTTDGLIVSLTLIVLPFLPATNLLFYVGFVIAERILYIPSMGYILLITLGLRMILSNRKSIGNPILIRSLAMVGVCVIVISFASRTFIRNRDWLSEENLYKAGISINPPKAYGNLANILSSKGHKSEAEIAYRRALSYRSNMADVHYNLGILLQEQSKYEEALKSYESAIRFRPRLTMAHLNIGLVLTQLGRKKEAIKVYQHCSQLDSHGLKDPRTHETTRISALFNLGQLYSENGQYSEAIEVFKQAIAMMPPHYQPQSLYNMLGEAYFKLSCFEEAENWYKEALQAKKDHIPAHLTYGKLLAKWNRSREAERWFLKAERIAPNDSSVYQHYGQFLSESKRYQEAADCFSKAAQLAPNDYEIVFSAANALREASRNEEAERYYKRAVTLRPNDVTSHMNLGAMLHLNGKLTEAEASYMEALRLKPDDNLTQSNLIKLKHLKSQRMVSTTKKS